MNHCGTLSAQASRTGPSQERQVERRRTRRNSSGKRRRSSRPAAAFSRRWIRTAAKELPVSFPIRLTTTM